jgi:NAD(P)-dependent dehydrogenase (short-subunit alcohol dehydrogenase family)
MQKKVALITGAGRRLGRAIALDLAKNGYEILLHYFQSHSGAMQTAAEIQNAGRSVHLLRADLTHTEQIEPMVAQGFEKFGQIDLLVNNAGVFIRKKIPDTCEADWDYIFNLNLKAPFFCAQAVARHMLQSGGGKIINLASVGGILPYANHCAYSTSKAGLIMLTQCLARELAPSILVNAIAPGSIAFPAETSPTGQMPLENIPLGRFATPEEVADLVLFLAEKANYMTGQVFPLDGGRLLV